MSMGSSSESVDCLLTLSMVGSCGKMKVGRVGIKRGADGLLDRLR